MDEQTSHPEPTTPQPINTQVSPISTPIAPVAPPPAQPVSNQSPSKPPEEKGKTPLLVGILIALLVLLGLGLIFFKPSFDSKLVTVKTVKRPTATKSATPVASPSAEKTATSSSK